MDLPGFAGGALGQAVARLQAEIEMDEIEGRADPGDSRDHVEPPDRHIQPLHEDQFHDA
jgi:hypothetical protein